MDPEGGLQLGDLLHRALEPAAAHEPVLLLLEAVADPGHERHEEMIERVGEGYDPAVVDVNGLAETVRALAERWSRPSGRRDS